MGLNGFKQRLQRETQNIIARKHVINGFMRKHSNKEIYGDVKRVAYDYCGLDKKYEKYSGLERVSISAPPARRYSAWIGGSIFASTDRFWEECITGAAHLR